MKHYYYRYKQYDRKRKRWVTRRGSYAATHELVIGHEYVSTGSYGLFIPVKLELICEDDELVYEA